MRCAPCREQAGKALDPEEVAVFDAGFSLAEVRAKTPRFVVRLAKNATVRRNFLPQYKGHGRHPEYGERLRPLARTRADKQLEASPADATCRWYDGNICLHAHVWKGVVLPEEKPGAPSVNVVAIYDPRYPVCHNELRHFPFPPTSARAKGKHQNEYRNAPPKRHLSLAKPEYSTKPESSIHRC